MGIVDVIKNALFEVEYVEEKKKDDKVKKSNENEKKKDKNTDKPIAKKVILPNPRKEKKSEMVEENNSYEHNDIDNNAEPLPQPNPLPSEQKHNDFKMMDDNDFRVEDEYSNKNDVIDNTNYKDEEDKIIKQYDDVPVHDDRVIYKKEVREKTPYGIDEANKSLIQEYGKAYEKKEEKTGFKPSPIISPIYGVLDKNYKKEDVKEKRDVHISSYSRENVSVDDVRNKAYGVNETRRKDRVEEHPEEKKVVFEEEDDDTDLLVDLSKDDDKPAIKEVTMGDALEYFQDLGLEYNVDYMDASKEKASGRRVKSNNYDEEPELFAVQEIKEEEDTKEKVPQEEPVRLISDEVHEDVKKSVIVENNGTSSSKEDIDVENENLFDLIDSMYDEEK